LPEGLAALEQLAVTPQLLPLDVMLQAGGNCVTLRGARASRAQADDQTDQRRDEPRGSAHCATDRLTSST
jgi:hypothetical protein